MMRAADHFAKAEYAKREAVASLARTGLELRGYSEHACLMGIVKPFQSNFRNKGRFLEETWPPEDDT
jgi:hypothetical protein